MAHVHVQSRVSQADIVARPADIFWGVQDTGLAPGVLRAMTPQDVMNYVQQNGWFLNSGFVHNGDLRLLGMKVAANGTITPISTGAGADTEADRGAIVKSTIEAMSSGDKLRWFGFSASVTSEIDMPNLTECYIDFGGMELNRAASSQYVFRSHGSDNAFANLFVNGGGDTYGTTGGGSTWNHGVIDSGNRNTLIGFTVSDTSAIDQGSAFYFEGNYNTLIGCKAVNPGYGGFRATTSKNVHLIGCTNHFTSADRGAFYPHMSYDNEVGGPFQVGEPLTWHDGAGTVRAMWDAGATGWLAIQKTSGNWPNDNDTVTGTTSGATADCVFGSAAPVPGVTAAFIRHINLGTATDYEQIAIESSVFTNDSDFWPTSVFDPTASGSIKQLVFKGVTFDQGTAPSPGDSAGTQWGNQGNDNIIMKLSDNVDSAIFENVIERHTQGASTTVDNTVSMISIDGVHEHISFKDCQLDARVAQLAAVTVDVHLFEVERTIACRKKSTGIIHRLSTNSTTTSYRRIRNAVIRFNSFENVVGDWWFWNLSDPAQPTWDPIWILEGNKFNSEFDLWDEGTGIVNLFREIKRAGSVVMINNPMPTGANAANVRLADSSAERLMASVFDQSGTVHYNRHPFDPDGRATIDGEGGVTLHSHPLYNAAAPGAGEPGNVFAAGVVQGFRGQRMLNHNPFASGEGGDASAPFDVLAAWRVGANEGWQIPSV